MPLALDVRRSSWGHRTLLWGSWACLAISLFALAGLRYASGHEYAVGMLMVAAPIVGLVLAGMYLALGIWLPVQWRLGLGSLVANGAGYVLFWVLLPGE